MHAVLKATLARRLATVMVTLGSYIGVAALTRLGPLSNVALTAEMVRAGTLGIEDFSSLTREAAIHSFSNVYHCDLNNGSAAGLWCCGAQEGTPESEAGCCNTTLFNPVFTGGFQIFFAPATELNISATNASASNATQGISTPGSSSPFACSPGANLTASQNAPASKPQQQSHERVTIGVGVGIPLGVIAFMSILLLFREHRLRLCAESTAGIINDKRLRGGGKRLGRALPEAEARNAPQELGHEQNYPNELNSQEVYEVATHGSY